MLRLTRRAGLLFATYAGLLLAVLIAGFLATALGIWGAITWGVVLLTGLVLYIRRRGRMQAGPSA
jgi:hypothetical protein